MLLMYEVYDVLFVLYEVRILLWCHLLAITFTFQLSGQHGCLPFSPPVLTFSFYFLLRRGFSIPTARRFSSFFC